MIPWLAVLQNDTDGDDFLIVVSITDVVDHGIVALFPNGRFTLLS